jgi:hypothetical protein
MSKTPSQIAIERANSETEVCYELVFCVPPFGFAMFEGQRKRFAERSHALVYAAMHDKTRERGIHFAILHGTRKQVASTPKMMPKEELFDITDDMAVPSGYRFGIAWVDTTGKVVDHNVDNDIMRFMTREKAQAALDFINKYMNFVPKTDPTITLQIVPVVGMDGVF